MRPENQDSLECDHGGGEQLHQGHATHHFPCEGDGVLFFLLVELLLHLAFVDYAVVVFLSRSVRVDHPSSNHQGQKHEANDVAGKEFKQNQGPVVNFAAVDSSWAHLAKLYRVKSLTMVTSVEILSGGEKHKEDMQRERDAWFAVPSVVQDN